MKIRDLCFFAAGCVAGAVLVMHYAEKKYSEMANEEIESVKETFNNRLMDFEKKMKESDLAYVEEKKKEEKKELVEDTMEDVAMKLNPELHVATDDEFCYEGHHFGPYEISDEEYGYENDTQSFLLTSDNVLLDDHDEIIIDPHLLIGESLIKFINDPIKESLYVRNEDESMDYEVLKSEKTYKEIVPDGEEIDE